MRALFAIGPDGSLIHDTDYPSTPDLSLADRYYFRLHKGTPAGSSRSQRRWRSLRACWSPRSYFEALYRRVQRGEDEAIALFHRDGTLIARFPAAERDIAPGKGTQVQLRFPRAPALTGVKRAG